MLYSRMERGVEERAGGCTSVRIQAACTAPTSWPSALATGSDGPPAAHRGWPCRGQPASTSIAWAHRTVVRAEVCGMD